MKRFLAVGFALSAGLLGGCSDSQTVLTDAGLAGTYDLTFVNNYVFVTSSDRNELRVLDLGASPRDFVRAPNPLEPLSITVLPRPLSLTRDVAYGTTDADLGKETAGPYVYARSAGSQEISVVAAAPEYFKEVKRLSVTGFITAFSARGPRGGSNSTLYYATQGPEGATIYRVELPGPEALLEAGGALPAPESRLSLPGQTVTALLTLPATRENPGQEHLAVATRRVTSENQGSPAFRTFRWDAATGQTLQEYAFGAPVRLLATHPRVERTAFETQTCALDATVPAKPSLEAGAYIFGVLDESGCGPQACSGVLAVDAATGQIATDSTQLPMQPISVGTALPTGLTLAPSAALQIRCTEQSTEGLVLRSEFQARPLVGIVPASNGQITFFDAVKLRPFDLDSTGVRIGSRAYVDAANQTRTVTRGTLDQVINVQMLDGATTDSIYRIVYQGVLPGLGGRSLSDTALVQCTGTECAFQVGAGAITQRTVEAQDLVILEEEGGACATNLTVTRTEARPDGTGVAFTAPLPAECGSPVTFSFRAAGTRPFAVYIDGEGYVGRLGDGEAEQLTIPGGYFFRPPAGFDPNRPSFRAILTLFINRESLEPLPQRGDQFVVSTVSGYRPFVFAVDTSSGTGLASYRLPGPVVYTQVAGASYAYIAYPSADGVLQLNMTSILDNAANATGLVPYE